MAQPGVPQMAPCYIMPVFVDASEALRVKEDTSKCGMTAQYKVQQNVASMKAHAWGDSNGR